MVNPPPGGRPRLSSSALASLYVAADGACSKCGADLPHDWADAHLVAWADNGGGRQAWCSTCNLGAVVRPAPAAVGIEPRDWQAAALPTIVEQIYQSGYATLMAAPGAGKTLFAGIVFQQLLTAGLADRLLVAVPRTNLVHQWAENLSSRLGLQIDYAPSRGFHELDDTLGLSVTYHGLPTTAKAHRGRLDRVRTLVVLDEVHHLGTEGSWGDAVRTIVGDVTGGQVHAAGVLNTTGTLFRSSKRQRISTVRYVEVEDNKIEAVADYQVHASTLIQSGTLRLPQLYRMAAKAEVVDLQSAEVTSGEIADLDAQKRKTVTRNMIGSRDWLTGFIKEALGLLELQQRAIGRDGESLKMLFIAPTIKHAGMAANTINEITNSNFARVVTSDDGAAHSTLKKVVSEDRPCAIVSCQMIAEGFDHPPVAVIAYASNILADLFIAQMMARAMRITATERHLGRVLPAAILIPNHPEMIKAFEHALIGQLHVLEVRPDEIRLPGPSGGPGFGPRFELVDLSSPELHAADVLGEDDGSVLAAELNEWRDQLRLVHVPEIYAPQIAVAQRRIKHFPRLYRETDDDTSTIQTRAADPRSMNVALRARIDKMAKWMQWRITNFGDDRFDSIGQFQWAANDAAGIPTGGRPRANSDQLAACAAWMVERIVDHCNQYDHKLPSWLESDTDE